jgi:sugar O-acyltransferase (sialic acid O-acetyltransferase NeuD family)
MSGRLVIYGAGGHARKVFHYAVAAGWQVACFVDDSAAAISPSAAVAVIRPAELQPPAPDDAVFVAIGDPGTRRVLMNRLAERGWRLPVLQHRSACVAPDVLVGPGTLVAAGAILETGTIVGRGVIIDIGVVVDHECRIGDFCHLEPGTVLGPRSEARSPL